MRWLLALRSGTDLKAALSAALLLALMAAGPPSLGQADPPKPSPQPNPGTTKSAQQPDLKASVTLIGTAAANDALALPVPPSGRVSLVLLVKNQLAGHPQAELRTLPFSTQDQSPAIATAKIRTGGSAAAGESASISLDRTGQIPFLLEFDRIRPEKTYRGLLVLTSGDLVHQWTLTLTTGGRGGLAVDPVGVLKFVTWPLFESRTGSFSFTVRDKSDGGPYSHLHARFQPSGVVNSKALSSNFSLDSISFWDKDAPLDLYEKNGSGQGSIDGGTSLARERTFTACISQLSPGEYSGTLQFAADGTADDAMEAKLPLVVQVRHHWLLPILVIVLGSLVGWFASKYVVGKRKARQWSHKIKELQDRIESLAHTTVPSEWEFPSEAISLGYAHARVELKRLEDQADRTMENIFHEDEIEQSWKSTDFRLSALESLQRIRLLVQPCADDRPAAQLAIGQLLRQATSLLEGPRFGDLEQAALTKVLDAIAEWVDKKTFGGVYLQALIERRNSCECPSDEDVQGLHGPVHHRLAKLMKNLQGRQPINEQTPQNALRSYDELIARVALLWREKRDGQLWADDIAEADTAGKLLLELFHKVDEEYWDLLKTEAEAGHFKIEMNPGDKTPKTYEIMELNLNPVSSPLKAYRILHHPLRVMWEIQPPAGNVRVMETNGLTLVQYFPSAGSVTVKASLHWAQKEPIQITAPWSSQVETNPEYSHISWIWAEWMAFGIAMIFAAVTGIVSQYDSTFGTFNQYLALFLWAAGATTGGNLFSQFGTASAPGGQAKVGFS